MKKIVLFSCVLLGLAACGEPKKDYQLSTICSELGYQPGTKEHDECMDEQRSRQLMEQNREEFKQRKQDEEYWRTRRSLERF